MQFQCRFNNGSESLLPELTDKTTSTTMNVVTVNGLFSALSSTFLFAINHLHFFIFPFLLYLICKSCSFMDTSTLSDGVGLEAANWFIEWTVFVEVLSCISLIILVES